MPVQTKQINVLFATLPEAHFLFKGLYEGPIDVRIEGTVRDFGYRKETLLRVNVYWNGHLMTYFCNPFKTMTTARKRAKEMLESLARTTLAARQSGLARRADYNTHMTEYRTYNANKGRPYYDYRRKSGPVILDEFTPRYDQHVADFSNNRRAAA